MRILAFSSSGSSTSINRQLVAEALTHFRGHDIDFVNLIDYDMTIYNKDKELSQGIPEKAMEFATRIDRADLIIISMAEHNGAYTALFKNLFDWVSRIPGRKAFAGKKMFLLGTSPGALGASIVLGIAAARFPRNGGHVVETFSLPSFEENFKPGKGITDPEKRRELLEKIDKVKTSINQVKASIN